MSFNPLQQQPEEPEQWIFSYADFMTLVACFFILMTSMASFDKTAVQATREIARHFNPEEVAKIEKQLKFLEEQIKKHPELKDANATFTAEDIKKAGVRLDDLKKEISKYPELLEHTDIKIKESDLVVVFTSNFLFADGDYKLSEDYMKLLDAMIDTLKTDSSEYRVLIEGYADDSKAHNSLGSEWQLSSARASVIADRFEYFGFIKENIVAVGHGSTNKVFSSKDRDGNRIEVNAKMNRRATIKFLEPATKKKVKIGLGSYFED